MPNKRNKPAEKWQTQKSALTRDRIVIATLECIVEHGYENTTMAKIAKTAKVSQGAMQYHFGSRIEAIKAAISYLHTKRLEDHQLALEDVPKSVDPMVHVIDLYWRQLNEDHFVAYQELVIAARTHPELASVLKPAYQKFLRAWRANALAAIPDWGDVEQFDLIADIGQYLMEGLAYGRLNKQIGEKQTKKLLSYTKNLLVSLISENQKTIS